eukprot:11183511-Lingulodinium_polyedra.AAC.1
MARVREDVLVSLRVARLRAADMEQTEVMDAQLTVHACRLSEQSLSRWREIYDELSQDSAL